MSKGRIKQARSYVTFFGGRPITEHHQSPHIKKTTGNFKNMFCVPHIVLVFSKLQKFARRKRVWDYAPMLFNMIGFITFHILFLFLEQHTCSTVLKVKVARFISCDSIQMCLWCVKSRTELEENFALSIWAAPA